MATSSQTSVNNLKKKTKKTHPDQKNQKHSTASADLVPLKRDYTEFVLYCKSPLEDETNFIWISRRNCKLPSFFSFEGPTQNDKRQITFEITYLAEEIEVALFCIIEQEIGEIFL